MRRSRAAGLCMVLVVACLASAAETKRAPIASKTKATAAKTEPAKKWVPNGPPAPGEEPQYVSLGPPLPKDVPAELVETAVQEPEPFGPPSPGIVHKTLGAFSILLPLEGHVASAFGKLRGSPKSKRGMRHHEGIDLSSPTGTPIHAAATGMVIRAASHPSFGRHVVIQHEGGFTTLYAHMSKILVKAGQSVEAGDLIGKVGRTGRATGPHLHFEIRHNDAFVDPEPLLVAAAAKAYPEEVGEDGVDDTEIVASAAPASSAGTAGAVSEAALED